MAFISVKSIAKGKGFLNNHGRIANYDLALSKGKAGNGFALHIYIPPKTLKQARFIDGDRVDLLFDPVDQSAMLTRVTEGGWKISRANKQSAGCVSLSINWLPADFPIPDKVTPAECTIADSGILFKVVGNKPAKDYQTR